MFQQILSMVRRASLTIRTTNRSRRSANLAALALEERATPAVVDGSAPPVLPNGVQVAPINHEANVRADLFCTGGSETPVHPPEENSWFVSLTPDGEGMFCDVPAAPPAVELTSGALSDVELAA